MRNGRAAAALLLLAAGCTRCGKAGGPPPEQFLPSNASLAVVVPSLRVAQEQLAPLSRTIASFPAAGALGEMLQAIRDQLGFDPLDARGIESAGIDAARGAAVALAPGAPPLLVVPVGDAGRFEALVTRLARDRVGAARRETSVAERRTVTVFRAAESAPVALALVVTQGTALLSPGPDGPARVAAAAAQDARASLAGSGAFERARAAMARDAAIVAFTPAGSPFVTRTALARDGAALGMSASATRLSLRGVLLLSPDRREFWRATLAAGAAPATGAPGRLPADAFLVGRYQGDPATVARRLLPLTAARADLRRAGLDLDRDLLDLLAPGATAAVSLAPTFEVAAVSRASDLGLDDPFRLVLLAGTFEVKDPDSAATALDRLARATPAPGGALSAAQVGPRRWRIALRGTSLDVALEGRSLLVGGGRGSLDALLARDRPGYAAPTELSRAALASGAAGAVLDLERLVASFRALPSAAYGTGPDAFVMRSLAERVIDPASRLVAASVRLDLAADAALVDVVIEAQPVQGGVK